MLVFDASSMIHAWDNYPVQQFPPMWDWLAEQISNEHIRIPTPVFVEITHVAPDCATWLSDNGLVKIEMTDAILLHALQFKNALGISGERYGSGVDENDLIVIACAKAYGVRLVSNEALQPGLPRMMQNYKIPAVCIMANVKVECINFIEFLRQSREVFGG